MAQTNLQPIELPDLTIRLWHGELQARGGLGYKDNITLSGTDPQSSAFWLSGVEALAFRLPAGGWRFSSFLDAIDIRYFDAPDVDNEQQVVAVGELTRDLGNHWNSTLGFNYLFQNQVFDFSATYTNEAAIGQIIGHTLTPHWRVRKEIRTYWLETKINVTRQWLEAPLDNYWQISPTLTAGRSVGASSNIRLDYQWSWLDFDSRLQADSSGYAITNTSLALQSHLIDVVWRHTWDDDKRWHTTTRAGIDLTYDNGSGFYDYRYYHLAGEVRFSENKWEARLGALIRRYDYPAQPVSADNPSNRQRTRIAVTLQVEREIIKHLKAFASYAWDNSISNLSFDDYQANAVVGGLKATF